MLAWRRTSLSLLIASLVIGRLAIEDHAPVVAAISLAGAVVTLWLVLASLRGNRWSAPARVDPRFDLLLRDGRLPALLVLVAGSLCLVELALAVAP